jgi:RsiW-degrading membrane proteinase PrsW (M82 family)
VSHLELVGWAVAPPLLLLAYYFCRVPTQTRALQLLLFFALGAISGAIALGLEWGFEFVANRALGWHVPQSLLGVALRQLLEVGPIEEGCKFSSVFLFLSLKRSRQPPKRIEVFFLTAAVALGFTVEENWIYLANETASVLDRAIGTPVHWLFSAPWGYALGVAISPQVAAHNSTSSFPPSPHHPTSPPARSTIFEHNSVRAGLRVARAWLDAVFCHASVNVLSSAWRYPPLSFLSYCLFPFLLWLFWRMESLLRRVQGKPPLILVSGRTLVNRYWQRGLILFALLLGGNAIFSSFLLARTFSFLSPSQLFSPSVWWFATSRFVLNLMPGAIALAIYYYLRRAATRR